MKQQTSKSANKQLQKSTANIQSEQQNKKKSHTVIH